MGSEAVGLAYLLVDGSVGGVVHLDKGKLVIGPTAKLQADIAADEALVEVTSRETCARAELTSAAMVRSPKKFIP